MLYVFSTGHYMFSSLSAACFFCKKSVSLCSCGKSRRHVSEEIVISTASLGNGCLFPLFFSLLFSSQRLFSRQLACPSRNLLCKSDKKLRRKKRKILLKEREIFQALRDVRKTCEKDPLSLKTSFLCFTGIHDSIWLLRPMQMPVNFVHWKNTQTPQRLSHIQSHVAHRDKYVSDKSTLCRMVSREPRGFLYC